MDTLSEQMNRLHAGGWTAQLDGAVGGLACGQCRQVSRPEDATVDQVFRFEGESDPGDESILFAITPSCGHRGTFVGMYGPGTPPETADVVTRLRLDRH